MRFEWDQEKAASNLRKHGVAFESALEFRWEEARVEADLRFNYGEVRLRAVGPILDRLHVLIFTVDRRVVRVISLRRASRREYSRYVGQS